MFKNLFISTFRTLRKNVAFSMLNAVGLAVGLASCVLILSYVHHERSFDRFHSNTNRIVRAYTKTTLGATPNYSYSTAVPFGDFVESTYPDVESVVRVFPGVRESLVRRGDVSNYENGIAAAEPTVFEVFDFHLTRGDSTSSLEAPFTVVLTPGFAERYFRKEDPLGQTLKMQFWGKTFDFTVTGIVDPPPGNSHLQFDALMSFSTFQEYMRQEYDTDVSTQWNMTNPATYLLLRKGTDWRALDAHMTEGVVDQMMGGGSYKSRDSVWMRYHLQPLTDIHLGGLGLPIAADADGAALTVFTLIAFLILLIACINYMNLSTARASKRAREIGVRKTFGARRGQLVVQFLLESVLLSVLAGLLAVVLIEAVLPIFARLTDGALSVHIWTGTAIAYWLAGITLVTGILAGSYPAVVLSGFRPGTILRGGEGARRGGSAFRKVLVVFQFAGGIGLVIVTLGVFQQMRFVSRIDLGFDKEQVVAIPLKGDQVEKDALTLRDAMAELPGIRAASVTGVLPERITGGNGISVVGAPPGEGMIRRVLAADVNYDDVLNLKMVAGRWFDQERPSDLDGFVVNESAVLALELEHPLGMEINRNGQEGPIIGVVRDFHIESLHQPIQPLFIYTPRDSWDRGYVILKTEGNRTKEVLENLSETWSAMEPGVPFSFSFLDDRLDRLYDADLRQGKLFGLFATLGIFVACLGLFGLAAFTAEQRTREVGIRKVLGASVGSVVTLLSKDFLRLVMIAFVIAAPVAGIIVNRWLEEFAYRIHLGVGIFALTAGLAVGIAVFTVGWQAIRSAMADPVDALRYQ